MKRVTHYTEAEARDFFERLATYSAEYVRVALPTVHPHWPTTNCYDEWKFDNYPIGHTLHFTAGMKFSGTIRHFVLQHRASTHWVVAKALDRRFDQLRKDLELDKDLRSECVQMIYPDRPAWHAGWVNRFLAGTELRNAGPLRPCLKGKKPNPGGVSRDTFFSFEKYDVDDLDFYWWPNGWTAKVPETCEVLRVKTKHGVSFWESFSRGSVATVITLLRYLNSLYPGKLDPTWMICHHNLNPHKNDIVLPLDLHDLRNAVLFSREHVDDLDWLSAYDDFEDGFEDEDDPWMLRELDEMQADRAEEDLDGFEPYGKIVGKVDTKEEVITALHRLGFWLGEAEADPEAIRRAVRIFQRGRSLDVDGVAGPQTMKRLDYEMKSWRLRAQ